MPEKRREQKMYLKTVRISKIIPFHEVRDQDKFEKLTADMEENGWKGRPLLVIGCEGGYRALTGSHRLSAARKAGLEEVPVAWVECGNMFDDCNITTDDLKSKKLKNPEEICQILEECDEEAIELFSEDEYVAKGKGISKNQ